MQTSRHHHPTRVLSLRLRSFFHAGGVGYAGASGRHQPAHIPRALALPATAAADRPAPGCAAVPQHPAAGPPTRTAGGRQQAELPQVACRLCEDEDAVHICRPWDVVHREQVCGSTAATRTVHGTARHVIIGGCTAAWPFLSCHSHSRAELTAVRYPPQNASNLHVQAR